MHYLASLQASHGENVYFINCSGKISRCVMRDSLRGFPNEYDDNVCLSCSGFNNELKKISNFKYIDLEFKNLFISEKLLDKFIFSELNANELLQDNLRLDGLNLGLIVKSQYYLLNKRNKLDQLSLDEKSYLRDAIKTNLYLYLETTRIIEQYRIEQINVFGEYGQNLSVISAAKNNKIDFNVIDQITHRGPNRQLIYPRKYFESIKRYESYIEDFDKLYLSKDAYLQSYLDSEHNFLGNSWYSKQNIDENLVTKIENKIRGFKKVAGFFTSSIDEYEASRCKEAAMNEKVLSPIVFENQLQWLKHLITFSSSCPETLFIVRIHPREGRDQRSAVGQASHLQRLIDLFEVVPDNIIILWPNENYSSYHIMQHLDFAVVSWSSIGSELSRFCIPVISAFYPNPTYPEKHSGIIITKSVNEYEAAINDLNQDEIDMISLNKLITDSVTYYAYKSFSNVFDVSDVVTNHQFTGFYTNKLTKKSTEIQQYFSAKEKLRNLPENLMNLEVDNNPQDENFKYYLSLVLVMLKNASFINKDSLILNRIDGMLGLK
jgi:hypothetical protein